MKTPDCLLLLSGGIDSTTLLAQLVAQGRTPLCLTFDYGQTLVVEVAYAQANAARYECPWLLQTLDLSLVSRGCSLLGGAPIGQDRHLDQIRAGGTPSSYVPFRNGIMLAYAIALGQLKGIENLYAGANGLDSGNYWDDTASFASAMTVAGQQGTKPGYWPRVLFPFSAIRKADIVATALALDVDLESTLSCYQPDGRTACGRCDSCAQRTAAFAVHGLGPDGQAICGQ